MRFRAIPPSLFRLVISAISPSVVTSELLKLKEKRLGLNKEIHTLIIATATGSDIIAVFLFAVAMGMFFSTGIRVFNFKLIVNVLD